MLESEEQSNKMISLWKGLLLLSLVTLCRAEAVKIRLAGGTKSEGNVEVFYKGEWRYVCDDHFDMRDAKVVCRQLGFARALNFTTK